MWGATIFALVLCAMELLQGTGRVFTLCVFLYILLASLAVNIGGGMTRPSGAYTFFVAMGTLIVGVVAKAVLWEPGDSNLQNPDKSIAIYLGGMASLCLAVYLTRRIVPRKPWLMGVLADDNMELASKGCLAAGIGLPFLASAIGTENGSVGSLLGQLNHFVTVSIILGVAGQIKKTGGKSSVTPTVILASSFLVFFGGILNGGKQGFFTPIFAWLLVCAALRYEFKRSQVLAIVVVLVLMFQYLFPYAQFMRGSTDENATFSERLGRSVHLLVSPTEVREGYEGSRANLSESREDRGPQYFNSDVGLMERMQMISMDDALFELTDQHGPIGYLPTIYAFYNLVPHFIWLDKPISITGNNYAREMGFLPDEDVTTGISFGPLGEAYHMGKWYAIFVLCPLLWLMMFVIHESTTGSIHQTVWSLFLLIEYAHGGIEAMMGFVVYFAGFGTLILFITAYSTAYLMPIFGSLLGGPGRRMPRTPRGGVARRA